MSAMNPSQHASRQRGFTLIELMVVVAIIALAIALAVPYFGGAATTARQRSVVDKMIEDFSWARASAGVADASTLGIAGVTGAPTVQVILNNQAAHGCSWTTKINGTVDPAHSMTDVDIGKLAPGITCGIATDTLALPATFNFDAQGFISQTGSITYSSTQGGTGAGAAKFWPLLFLSSGSIIKTNAAS